LIIAALNSVYLSARNVRMTPMMADCALLSARCPTAGAVCGPPFLRQHKHDYELIRHSLKAPCGAEIFGPLFRDGTRF
jgi:hypothetical protein